MNATKVRTKPLNFWTCYFLDSEDGIFPTRNPGLVYQCKNQGRFLTSGNASPEEQTVGHNVCIFIVVLIYVVGLFGFVTNVLNVLVLRKSLKGSSLQSLLVILAIFELLSCLLCIVSSTTILLILENWSRGEPTLMLFKGAHVLYSLGRSVSIYITILVTIERYLVVAFPVRSKAWLTPIKSRIYLGTVIVFGCLLDLPWIFNSVVVRNNTGSVPGTSLAQFPFILEGTAFARNVYTKIRIPVLGFNYVAPFPLLLVFNGLLYLSIYNWNKNRQNLSRNQKKEMSAAKMFSVAVLILLLCHSVSCVIVFVIQGQRIIFRELMLLQILSVAVSAAVNFIVYYKFGRPFRKEFAKLMESWKMTAFGKKNNQYALANAPPVTQSSRADDGESTDNSIDDLR